MSESKPEPCPVDIVQTFDLVEVFGRHAGQVAASSVIRPESGEGAGVVRACPDQVRGHRLGRRSRSDLRPPVTQMQVQSEFVAGQIAEIGGACQLLEPGGGQYFLFAEVTAGGG